MKKTITFCDFCGLQRDVFDLVYQSTPPLVADVCVQCARHIFSQTEEYKRLSDSIDEVPDDMDFFDDEMDSIDLDDPEDDDQPLAIKRGAKIDKQNITVKELIDYLNISRPLAYQLVNSKGFPSFRIGKKILINVKLLNEWIDEQEKKQ